MLKKNVDFAENILIAALGLTLHLVERSLIGCYAAWSWLNRYFLQKNASGAPVLRGGTINEDLMK